MRKFFNKIKAGWPKFKNIIVATAKFVLTSVLMLMGLWSIYSIIWIRLGFPTTNVAMWLLFGHSVISEIIIFRWLFK